MSSIRDLATRASAGQYIGDLVRAEDRRVKDALAAEMTPGDRAMAALDGLTEIGTVSRAKITETSELAITDEAALLAWAEANGHTDGIKTIRVMEDWKAAELIRLAETTGELPDGVESLTRQRGGYISVRQSETQKDNLRTLIEAGALTGLLADLAQIEGNES